MLKPNELRMKSPRTILCLLSATLLMTQLVSATSYSAERQPLNQKQNSLDFKTLRVYGKLKPQNPTDKVFTAEISPDKSRFVTVTYRTLEPHERQVDYRHPEDGAATFIISEAAQLTNPRTGEFIAELKGHTGPIMSAEFSPDSKLILTASADGTARVWAAETGRLLHEIRVPFIPFRSRRSGRWVALDLKYAKFNSTGDRILTADGVDRVHLYDALSGMLITQLDVGPGNSVVMGNFSPDGKYVTTVLVGDRYPDIWQASNGAHVLRFGQSDEPGDSPVCGSLSPDSTWAAIESAHGDIRIYDFPEGTLRVSFRPPGDQLREFAISPDGTLLVTTSNYGKVQLFEVKTGKILREFVGHKMAVFGAGFSADGKRLLTWSADQTARIWDIKTGFMLATLRGHDSTVYEAKFLTPNGTEVLTKSHDDTVRIWEQLNPSEF